jgi:hypothetical protein
VLLVTGGECGEPDDLVAVKSERADRAFPSIV